jgi:hypothetical protein
MTLEERTVRGPQKRQSKKSLKACLDYAKARLQTCGSFGGALKWSPLVALFEQALGLAPTPKMWVGKRDGTEKQFFDFTTVKMDGKGQVSMLMKTEKS